MSAKSPSPSLSNACYYFNIPIRSSGPKDAPPPPLSPRELLQNTRMSRENVNVNVRESKIVLDSRSHFLDSRFQALKWRNLDSGLQSLVTFQIPKPMILDSRSKMFPDCGFHEQNFSDSGIRLPSHGAIYSWGYTKGLETADLTCGTCRRHATRLQPLPANDSARRPATL